MADVTGSFRDAGFQLRDGIGQAGPRLFGLAFNLL
jgi:hypothetical protein